MELEVKTGPRSSLRRQLFWRGGNRQVFVVNVLIKVGRWTFLVLDLFGGPFSRGLSTWRPHILGAQSWQANPGQSNPAEEEQHHVSRT